MPIPYMLGLGSRSYFLLCDWGFLFLYLISLWCLKLHLFLLPTITFLPLQRRKKQKSGFPLL